MTIPDKDAEGMQHMVKYLRLIKILRGELEHYIMKGKMAEDLAERIRTGVF